jgi:hypothetical protein
MIRETDRPELQPAVLRVAGSEAKEPMDYLVNALGRAVARKWTTGKEDTENRS